MFYMNINKPLTQEVTMTFDTSIGPFALTIIILGAIVTALKTD